MGIQSCLLSNKCTGQVSVDFRPSPRKDLIWSDWTLVAVDVSVFGVVVVVVVVVVVDVVIVVIAVFIVVIVVVTVIVVVVVVVIIVILL